MLRCSTCLHLRLTSSRFFSDFYKILGVERTADIKDIKQAFRKNSLECHPDKFPGDKAKEARFKMLSEAYQTLSDTKLRRDYDSKLTGTTPSRNTGGMPGSQQAYTNSRSNFRQYRSDENPFQRNERWNEAFEELNKQRYQNFRNRRPDFSDFMNGRRGTDWGDFRKTFKEDAHPFNESIKKTNRFYEQRRFSDYEKYARGRNNFAQYQQENSRKQSLFMLKVLSFLMVLMILSSGFRNQQMQTQEAQYYLNQTALIAAQRKIYEERMRRELAEEQYRKTSTSGSEKRSGDDK